MTILEKAWIEFVNFISLTTPNFLTFYNMFNRVPVKDITSIRLNVKDDTIPRMEYNPVWVERIFRQNKYLFFFVVYMELLRFVLHHCTHRFIVGKFGYIASNAVVNGQEARRIIDFLPNELRIPTLEYVKTRIPSREQLEDKGLTFEDDDFILEKVYVRIREESFEDEDNSKDNPDAETDVPIEGAGTSVPPKKDADPLEEHFNEGTAEENAEKWGPNDILDEEITETFEHCPVSGWGSLDATTVQKLQIANTRKINVKNLINRFHTSVIAPFAVSTRMRPDRRGRPDIPGFHHGQMARVLFAIDCSGSMSWEDIGTGASLLKSFLKDCVIDYCFWDQLCSAPKSFTKWNAPETDFEGIRGGTDPSCVGDYLRDHKLKYDGVIMFTDGYWQWSHNNIHRPVFVITTVTANSPGYGNLPKWIGTRKATLDTLLGIAKHAE